MLTNFASPKQGEFFWINLVKKLNNEKWYSSR